MRVIIRLVDGQAYEFARLPTDTAEAIRETYADVMRTGQVAEIADGPSKGTLIAGRHVTAVEMRADG